MSQSNDSGLNLDHLEAQMRIEHENTEFTEWWASSGQGADPAHTLITENACHATWQERARRGALANQPAPTVPAGHALRKLCDQLDAMKRRMRHTPGTGQNHSYLLHEDVEAYVEEARAALAHQPAQEQAEPAIGIGDPEAAFASFCDREGYPSDGEIDAALRAAFYEGIQYCSVDITAQQEPVAAPQQAVAPGALAIEAAKLASILRGMCEGGDVHGDGVDIYADGYIAVDGDTYVVRAAALLEQVAAAPAGSLTDEGTSAPGTPEAPSQLMQALTTGIPLQEPVYIAKALRAQREVRVSLAGGTGPGAAAFLANIQMTPWTYTKETAEAYAWGYNRALKDYRAALLDVAAQLDGGQGEGK